MIAVVAVFHSVVAGAEGAGIADIVSGAIACPIFSVSAVITSTDINGDQDDHKDNTDDDPSDGQSH